MHNVPVHLDQEQAHINRRINWQKRKNAGRHTMLSRNLFRLRRRRKQVMCGVRLVTLLLHIYYLRSTENPTNLFRPGSFVDSFFCSVYWTTNCPCPSLELNPVVCRFSTTFYPFVFGKNSGILMEACLNENTRSWWEYYFENLIYLSNQLVSSCDSVRHEIASTKALELTKIEIKKVVLQKLYSYVSESFVAMVNGKWWIWKAFHSLMNRRHFISLRCFVPWR